MREFTAKEKELFKKIAEKKKKKIGSGDYALINLPRLGEQVVLIDSSWELQEKGIYNYLVDEVYPDYIPVWQEHDCLKWLRRKMYWARIDIDEYHATKVWLFSKKMVLPNWEMYPCYLGNSPLEALLRTVLAVMEEASSKVDKPTEDVNLKEE